MGPYIKYTISCFTAELLNQTLNFSFQIFKEIFMWLAFKKSAVIYIYRYRQISIYLSISIYMYICIYLSIYLSTCVCQSLSRARLFATPWTAIHQVPLSMRFSRQGYWSGLPFPSPGDLPNPGIEPGSPALQANSLPTELQFGSKFE